VNERNLSRRLSASVVDALKTHGHILVVKGGATALARELDDLMAPEVTLIAPRIQPRAPLVGEPTSTFGDETVDQAVEDMVLKLTHALMNSDHVEDVFAEDAVIRRDIFRVVRDGLREPHLVDPSDDSVDQAGVTVKLDALGYVAATASRLTDASTLRQALDRAASVAGAHFLGFSPELREATFRLEGNGIDDRLEIEEAVADELTDLVEQGIVDLPTLERRVDLGRALTPGEQRTLRPRIEAAAQANLVRTGCPFAWELADLRTLRVLFTPLSEQDVEAIDAPTGAFAKEVAGLLGGGLNGVGPGKAATLGSARDRAPTSKERPPVIAVTVPAAPVSSKPASSKPLSSKAGRAAKAAAIEAAPITKPEATKAEAGAKRAAPKKTAASRKRTVTSGKPPAEGKPAAEKPAKTPASARKSTRKATAAAKATPSSKRATTASGKAAKLPAKKR
jgi:hypothetical protein